MTEQEIFDFLNEKADRYNRPPYLDEDPLQIPHRYTRKQDIEIAGFLTATIAWGNRKSIIKDAEKMMAFMGNSPFDFIVNHSEKDFDSLIDQPIHRTFNGADFKQFAANLQRLYRKENSLSAYFKTHESEEDFSDAIERFRSAFLNGNEHRSKKHVSSPYKNSAAKRLMMFLRWMVRKDQRSIDLGIWNDLNPAKLSCPLDVHSGRIARSLGILHRKQNDWKAVHELDLILRKYRPQDPAWYDYALFGIGVNHDLNLK